MIDLHSDVYDSPVRFCDWIELVTLRDERGTLSVAEIMDAVANSSSAIGDTDGDLCDTEDYLIADAWIVLKKRQTILGETYPFSIDSSTVKLTQKSWRDFPSYTFLSIIDIAHFYDDSSVALKKGDVGRELFEHLVAASQCGLFRGQSLVFPSSGDDDWPSDFKGRVDYLAENFGTTVDEVRLNDISTTDDKDGGLDVASRMMILDELPGVPIILTQCATGKNWKSKTGEPSLNRWSSMVRWKGPLMRTLAVPYRLEPGCPGLPRGVKSREKALERTSNTHNGSIILDRARLLYGNPDQYMELRVRQRILEWCEQSFQRLPPLDS